MRTKSETKRQAILDIAAQLFGEAGFERASMSELCARVGGSKATLYNYFSSKEEIFFEIMFRSTQVEFEAVHSMLDPTTDDIREHLYAFGKRFLTLLYSPEIRSARRLIVAESGRSELGRLCYERGPQRSQKEVAAFLQSAMDKGRLRQADPLVAAHHLHGLLESEFSVRFLFQVDDNPSAEEIDGAARRAIDAFMAAYGSRR
jgi:AcrR family transcriptional regulator